MAGAGVFISLDGLDGGGKTTHCRLLADWLRGQGRAVTVCRDPGGTPIGELIRELLLDRRSDMSLPCEMFLYMASRAQLAQQVIGPALERGEIVLADRYLLANVVYQGHAGGLGANIVWQVGRLATSELLPDLTLVLDVPVEQALARKDTPPDRMESRGAEFYQRVREGFLAEARRDPEHIHVIDTRQSIEAIQERIRAEVARVLGTRQGA